VRRPGTGGLTPSVSRRRPGSNACGPCPGPAPLRAGCPRNFRAHQLNTLAAGAGLGGRAARGPPISARTVRASGAANPWRAAATPCPPFPMHCARPSVTQGYSRHQAQRTRALNGHGSRARLPIVGRRRRAGRQHPPPPTIPTKGWINDRSISSSGGRRMAAQGTAPGCGALGIFLGSGLCQTKKRGSGGAAARCKPPVRPDPPPPLPLLLRVAALPLLKLGVTGGMAERCGPTAAAS